MKLFLYLPKYEDLWFRQKMLSDKETMSFNKAWGGTISFPIEKWEKWYNHWIVNNGEERYYRYLRNENQEFIGEIAYHFDPSYDGYMANVLIYADYRGKGYGCLGLQMLCDEAKRNSISTLYDDIAINNPGISIFLKLGFKEQYRTDSIILLKKEL